MRDFLNFSSLKSIKWLSESSQIYEFSGGGGADPSRVPAARALKFLSSPGFDFSAPDPRTRTFRNLESGYLGGEGEVHESGNFKTTQVSRERRGVIIVA